MHCFTGIIVWILQSWKIAHINSVLLFRTHHSSKCRFTVSHSEFPILTYSIPEMIVFEERVVKVSWCLWNTLAPLTWCYWNAQWCLPWRLDLARPLGCWLEFSCIYRQWPCSMWLFLRDWLVWWLCGLRAQWGRWRQIWTWPWTSVEFCQRAHSLWRCWNILLCTQYWWLWQTEHLELGIGVVASET
jgi:hypothetical protein